MAKPKQARLYKIEKGIKIPPVDQAYNGYPSVVALTLRELEVTDSFLVKDELDAMRARKIVQDGNGRGGRKFTTRKVGKGVRIWRVK